MKKQLAMALTLALGTGFTGAASAYDRGGDSEYYDYARVVSVVPLTRIVRVAEPRQQCWEEPVTRYRQRVSGGGDSYTPSILGGILGGVVGNRFGGGTGRDVMTVAGTVLGASLGRDVQRSGQSYTETYNTTEVHCETRNDYREVEQHQGYRVTYQYKGQEFVRHMDRDPGSRVRVVVSVDPATD